jgi:hypothetical protein
MPRRRRSGPPHGKAARDAKAPATALDVSRVAVELAAWGAAVEHLHAAGLPAAVPEFPAAWLRRRGVAADWVAAA